MDNDKYEEFVWKNARWAAKLLHKVKERTCPMALFVRQAAEARMNSSEIAALADMIHSPHYDAGRFKHDDGPEFGPDAPLDDDAYEVAKDAFRRIHADKF